ncbi:hypothetical protein DAPPUDRAFT_240923 [Daphnia pulex]|uniref:Uncharacterized protein n=1 Tax=Daphnia pulex TaxID=6669 RepID=E9GCY3_DAPPU|nr:hypothetical protein DAPPUDRAFT_240923 [Daphnia pulex]|eukprot:EFX82635.1 hypothetical protein DAPPUDRAFT_240923 [Daphnia pulex]
MVQCNLMKIILIRSADIEQNITVVCFVSEVSKSQNVVVVVSSVEDLHALHSVMFIRRVKPVLNL